MSCAVAESDYSMKKYIIARDDSEQRLNKFLSRAVPRLTGGQMHKYCRLKRIKINGKRTEPAYRLREGDVVELYLNDELFEQPQQEQAYEKIVSPKVHILYEDENILLADKAVGMAVHIDNDGDCNTLIAHIQAYLYQSGQWQPQKAQSFAPALCNRIDRGTGGIVIAAKNAEALRIINEKIRARELTKKYLCIACGKLTPPQGQIKNFLRKDEKQGRVMVYTKPAPDARTAITQYRTLASKDSLSLIECQLITGRTHQIRAQLAAAGAPLLGDGKYGNGTINRAYHERYQALYSYFLRFDFTQDAGSLQYLNQKTFCVKDIDFVKKYFPHIKISNC